VAGECVISLVVKPLRNGRVSQGSSEATSLTEFGFAIGVRVPAAVEILQ